MPLKTDYVSPSGQDAEVTLYTAVVRVTDIVFVTVKSEGVQNPGR